MRAVYDLGKMPTTFDFASWACFARTCGAAHVHFIVDGPIAAWKYPADVAWKRFANVLLPLCRLAGLEYSVGGREEGREFPYLAGKLNTLYQQTGRIVKLEPTKRINRSGFVTITLRDSFRNRYRNSNLSAWYEFRTFLESRGIEVEVFPECENQPIDLEQRMASYCAADMNFGVANGPMSLCIFSEAPYRTFNWYDTGGEKVQYDQGKLMAAQGLPEGAQFAFRNERQALIYERDTYDNIRKAWDSLHERKAA